MIKDQKILMACAATQALEYKKKNPKSESNEIVRHIMFNIDARGEMKIFAVAAADKALKLKINNPDLSDKQIMQMFMGTMDDLLMKS